MKKHKKKYFGGSSEVKPVNKYAGMSSVQGPSAGGPSGDQRDSAADNSIALAEQAVAQAGQESIANADTLDSIVAMRSKRLDERTSALRSRVVQAQRALDERTTKQRAEIEEERERLRNCQEALQRQARALAAAARVTAVLEEKRALRAVVDSSLSETDASDKKLGFSMSKLDSTQVREMLTVSLSEASAPSNPIAMMHSSMAARPDRSDDGTSSTISLNERVSEMLRMAEMEREAIESNQVAMESLRLEAERLNASLIRRRQKHDSRASKHHEQEEELNDAYLKKRRERELLAAKLKDLEAEENVIQSRIDECGRTREELDQEGAEINQAQINLAERHRVLRETLEHERHRLQVRQAELQRKVAELAEAARDKRLKVELAVAQQRADLEARMKAQRQEIEEAAKAELEKTAAELEQVLNLQLSEIESDLSTRRANLDQHVTELNRLENLDGDASSYSAKSSGTSEMIGHLTIEDTVISSSSADGLNKDNNLDLSRFDSLRSEIEALQQIKINLSGASKKTGASNVVEQLTASRILTDFQPSHAKSSEPAASKEGTLCPFPMGSTRRDG